MDHEYELEDDYAPRVLWGRLAFFAVALLLAFVFGRCTKSEGVPQAEFNEVQAQVVELTSENTVLQQQLTAAGAPDGGGGDGGEQSDGGEPEATEAPTEGEEPVGEGQRYTVQSGDTLTMIAEQFYGDPRKFDLIVDANNLDSATGLRVGQELVIPPEE
jgi:nucleoid-associated protein YgaU